MTHFPLTSFTNHVFLVVSNFYKNGILSLFENPYEFNFKVKIKNELSGLITQIKNILLLSQILIKFNLNDLDISTGFLFGSIW